jgi:hypothetical protein
MNKRSSTIVSLVTILIVVATVWIGRGWLWHKLLEMHGVH